MADFTALKTAIQNAIKQNGNEEITGNLLQDVLLAIVTTLGEGNINNLINSLDAEVTARQQAVSAEAQARQLGDSTLQGGINTAMQAINAINNAITNGCVYAGIATPSITPASGKVFYLAFTAGTYTNFNSLVVPQGINILKNNGSTWLLDSFLGIDDAPTPSSNNLVKSRGVFNDIMTNGSAFDLTAYNNGTTYADLNAALTALNALPAAYKKGGMSVKYVQTSDNKYVQARCMAQNFTTTVTQWQVVDDEPTVGSQNLVKSGGVKNSIINTTINFPDWQYIGQYVKDNLTIGQQIGFNNATTWNSFKIYVAKGNKLVMFDISIDVVAHHIYITDLNGKIIEIVNKTGELPTRNNYEYVATQNCYVVTSSNGKGYCIYKQLNFSELDTEPIENSKNPIESGAVYNSVESVKNRCVSNKDKIDYLYEKLTRGSEVPPQFTGKFINNFDSVSVGESFTPSYGTAGTWDSFKIPVEAGDVIKISKLRSFDSVIVDWIVFTDINNVVVNPSYHIDNSGGVVTLENLEYLIQVDGYVLFTNTNSIDYTVKKYRSIDSLIDDVNKVDEIESEIHNTRIVNTPTYPQTFINNFDSVAIGSYFSPSYISNGSWSSFKIPIIKGDNVHIDQIKVFDQGITDWIVFVNSDNIVVNPSVRLEDYGETLTDLNFVATESGYLYISSFDYVPSLITINSSIHNLYESTESLQEEIANLSSNVDTDTEDIVATAFLDCPINRQTDVFLDGIIRIEDDVKRRPYRITGNATIIQIGDNQLRMTPTALTNASISIYKYNNIEMNIISSMKSFTFRPVSRSVGDGTAIKNICISGDSLIDGTNAPCEAFRLLNEDGDFVIHQIGTRNATMDGITYKHEGRGSWGWDTYIDTRYGVYTDPEHPTTPFSNKLNEFMIDEELNFQKYMQRNFPAEVAAGRGIDIFLMSLGTNDVTQGSSLLTDTKMNQIINDAKTFIDTLLSADKGYPNCKIVVALPGVGAKSFIGINTFSSVFKMSILKLNKAYVDTFDNGRYHQNVTCVMHGCYIDRENGYQYEDVGRNEYINDSSLTSLINAISDTNAKAAIQYIADNYVSHRKTRRCLNQVHPLQVGYKQWGRGYYGKLRALVNGLL